MIRSHLVLLSRPSWRVREDKSRQATKTCAVALGVAWVATALGWAAHVSSVREAQDTERAASAYGTGTLKAQVVRLSEQAVLATPAQEAKGRALVEGWARTAFKLEGTPWGEDEVQAMADLAWEESRHSTTDLNHSSGAYGLYQFLDSTWKGTKIKRTSDGLAQTVAAVRYIRLRYGCPCKALAFQLTPRELNGVVQRYY